MRKRIQTEDGEKEAVIYNLGRQILIAIQEKDPPEITSMRLTADEALNIAETLKAFVVLTTK